MGATYTRQSDYSDGDTITAADTNDEFDQLLAAFAASSGHTHDGTTAEGGPVTKLLGNTLTFGAGTAGTDITITFDGEDNDGVLIWNEDLDYFEFSDDILIATTEKIQFRDTAIYINSSADGQLDLVADTEIQIAATTIDMNGNVDISGTLAVAGVLTGASLDISGDIDVDGTSNLDIVDIDGAVNMATTALVTGVLTTTATQVATGGITSGSNIVSDTDSTDDLGTTSVRWANLYVDAITATDQITATGFTGTLDGILGSGSAAAATVTTLDTSGAVNLNLVTDSTSSTSGALIVDGGVGIAKKLYVGTDLDVDGTTNLDVVDIDGAVDMASTLAVAGVLTGASLDISGDIDIDGTANLDIVDIDGAVDMATTLQVDGVATFTGRDIHSGGITIANAGQIGSVGDADAIAIASDGVVTLTQKLIGTELDISGNIDVDGTTNLDNTDIDGTLVVDGSNISLDSTSTLNIDNSNTTNGITIGTATSGVPVSIGHSTSETTVNDNLTVTGDFTVNGTTTTVATTNMVVADNLIELNNGATSNANDSGIVIERGSTGDNAIFMWDESADTFVLGTTTATGASTGSLSVTDGALQAGSLDISGNIDVDGTTNLDAVDIDGAVQLDATLTVGANDQGYDVILYGDTASANLTWDTSADDLIFNGAAGLIVPDGQLTLGSTAITSTAAEINLIDGGTARGTTAVASGDGILINDAGTMRMTNVDTVSTYFAGHSVGGGNIVTTGALNSGSITSGFGAIDNGSSNITTTGVGSFGSLDISGAIDVDGITNLDVVDIDGAVDMASTLQVDGAITTTGNIASTSSGVISNSLITSSTNQYAEQLFQDGNAGYAVQVRSDNAQSTGTGSFVINDRDTGSFPVVIKEGNASNTLVLSNNKVAVGTATATATLTVEGSAVGKTDTDTSNTGSVTLDYTANQNFVLTMTGNVTLANPSTENVGQSGFISFIQDGTGSRVLSVGSQYFCAGGSVIVLSTAANSIDIVPYVVIAAGKICLGAPQLAFADAS